VGKSALLNFEHGIVVEGQVIEIIRRSGKVIVIECQHATVQLGGNIILVSPSYSMAVGEKIISAFAGPADVEAFEPTVMVPHEKMHKIIYDEKALELQELYGIVRQARRDGELVQSLPSLWKNLIQDFPDDWLLSLEILEILQCHPAYQQHGKEIQTYLERKRQHQPHLEKLITNGLKLLGTEAIRKP